MTTTETATHQVALSFEDGVTRFIEVREDQTVADASYRQRINIPLDCRDGACGTCKALCESGEYEHNEFLDDALPQDEAEQGYVLPCSLRPSSDLTLQIASTSAVAKTGAATFTGTVKAITRLSPSTIELALSLENRGELAFLPGQYVNFTVPGAEAVRSYSFANGPQEEVLRFLIKVTPGGAMTGWLTGSAQIGDEVSFTGPHGSFFLRETNRAALLLAGGTGLAPIVSMVRALVAGRSERTAHLVYGVSTDDDLVLLDEVEELVSGLPNVTWTYTVSDQASTAPNTGRITAHITPDSLHDGDVAVYLCGPPAMVEGVRTHFKDNAIQPYGFYYEKFATASVASKPRVDPSETETSESSTSEAPRSEESALAVEPSETLTSRPQLPPEPAAPPSDGEAAVLSEPTDEPVIFAPDGRSIAGQEVLPADATIQAWQGDFPDLAEDDLSRRIAGQNTFAGADLAPLVEPEPVESSSATTDPVITDDGYIIGEEHPDIAASDALFEARAALELGALEVTLGRLNSQQLTGYRLLADATLPYVEGDRFLDAAAYTETNAAFHDYLFSQTGNAHLLAAYQALGVKGRMGEVLRHATWCDPQVAIDHVQIVEAFERGDRDEARALITKHAERSKETMRRAMTEAVEATRPKFVSPGRFSDTVVAVTGAAQGIGAHVARRVAAEGGSVLLVDRSPIVHEVADSLTSLGEQAVAIECDLESYDGAATMLDAAQRTYGRVDVLINNVGGAINFKPFEQFTAAEIDAEITRSLLTTLYATRAVVPGMIDRKQGVIINVSSAATRGIHRIPYSAAKGGVNALTQSLAYELAPHGIRVAATAPGGTQAPERRISRGTPTPTNQVEQAWFQAHIDQTIEASLLHRYGTLEEQAAAICFLASAEASYITGTVLPVAGGDLG